jgi:hypothetical protein
MAISHSPLASKATRSRLELQTLTSQSASVSELYNVGWYRGTLVRVLRLGGLGVLARAASSPVRRDCYHVVVKIGNVEDKCVDALEVTYRWVIWRLVA